MRKGRSLEKLVRTLERILAGHSNITVESPKRVIDRITNKKREHDVVITIKEGHHEICIAIECRDRKRIITVNDVEGFCKKCQDTGMSQGIIVSAKGFSSQAVIKAGFFSIRCLSLKETDSFQWLLTDVMKFMRRDLKHTNLTANIKSGLLVKDSKDYILVDSNGVEINAQIINPNISGRITPENIIEVEPGKGRSVVQFSGQGIFLKHKDTGDLISVENLIAISEWEITREVSPFKLVKYEDREHGEITTAAIAATTIKGFEGELVIIGKEDEDKKICFVPKKPLEKD